MDSGYVHTNKGNQLLGLSDSPNSGVKDWIRAYLNKFQGSDMSWYEFMDRRIQKRKNANYDNMTVEEQNQTDYYSQFDFNTSDIISEWEKEYPELFGISTQDNQYLTAGNGGNSSLVLIGGVLLATGITYYLTKNN